MRIAQVAPLYESVPPKLYGGTERVVAYLTEALIDEGHDVTLFASGDSKTRAELVAACPEALRLDTTCQDPLAYHMILLDQVFESAQDFDLLHFHIDYLHFPISARLPYPHLTTLHGRLDLPCLKPLYRQFANLPLVSISYAQRTPLPFARWEANVYHGVPVDLYSASSGSHSYLAFLGRISPEKGIERAIEIAKRSEVPIKIAAKVDKMDREYFEACVKPLLADPLVEFIGEVGDHEKGQLLGGAMAMLFPIDWPEPFGMAMIESMACGTPVIAFPGGSVPEVVDHGVTGLIVRDVESAVEAVAQVRELRRESCRERFDQRFTSARMARDYIAVYHSLLARHLEVAVAQ